MGFTGFGHIGIVVSDIERSIDFYQNTLGFEKVTEFERPERHIVFLKICDGQTVELFSGGTEKREIDMSTIGFAHFCLIVDGIVELAARLKAAGVTLLSEPTVREDGSGSFNFLDPDGNRFECMQRGANSKF